jgi:hypothetical protein
MPTIEANRKETPEPFQTPGLAVTGYGINAVADTVTSKVHWTRAKPDPW